MIKKIDKSTFMLPQNARALVTENLEEYKTVLQKGECLSYLFSVMYEESWREFLAGSLYYKGNLNAYRQDLNQIQIDIIRCFALFLSSRITSYIIKKEPENVLNALKATTMVTI